MIQIYRDNSICNSLSLIVYCCKNFYYECKWLLLIEKSNFNPYIHFQIRSKFHCLNPCQIILDQRKNKYNIQKGIDILHQTVLVRINKDSSFSFNNQMMNTAKRHQLIPLFHKKIRKSSLFKYRQIPSLSNVMNSKEFQYGKSCISFSRYSIKELFYISLRGNY